MHLQYYMICSTQYFFKKLKSYIYVITKRHDLSSDNILKLQIIQLFNTFNQFIICRVKIGKDKAVQIRFTAKFC